MIENLEMEEENVLNELKPLDVSSYKTNKKSESREEQSMKVPEAKEGVEYEAEEVEDHDDGGVYREATQDQYYELAQQRSDMLAGEFH